MEIETGAGETIYIYSSDKIPHSSFLERTNESIHSSTAFLDGTNQPTCTYACFERPFFNKAPLSLHVRLSLAPWDFFFLIPRGAPFSPSSSSVQLCIYTLERTSSFSFPPPPPTPHTADPTRPKPHSHEILLVEPVHVTPPPFPAGLHQLLPPLLPPFLLRPPLPRQPFLLLPSPVGLEPLLRPLPRHVRVLVGGEGGWRVGAAGLFEAVDGRVEAGWDEGFFGLCWRGERA